LFVLSVHLPETIKIPGLFTIGVGLLAGWGLGRWGIAQKIAPTVLVAIVAGLAIVAGDALATLKAYRDWVAYEENPKWDSNNPFVEMTRESLGEEIRQARLQRLTLSRFLASRVRWRGRIVKWPTPWPAVLWGAEALLAGSLGGWLALKTLRGGTPAPQ